MRVIRRAVWIVEKHGRTRMVVWVELERRGRRLFRSHFLREVRALLPPTAIAYGVAAAVSGRDRHATEAWLRAEGYAIVGVVEHAADEALGFF